jgi:hypothetical protein
LFFRGRHGLSSKFFQREIFDEIFFQKRLKKEGCLKFLGGDSKLLGYYALVDFSPYFMI